MSSTLPKLVSEGFVSGLGALCFAGASNLELVETPSKIDFGGAVCTLDCGPGRYKSLTEVEKRIGMPTLLSLQNALSPVSLFLIHILSCSMNVVLNTQAQHTAYTNEACWGNPSL